MPERVILDPTEEVTGRTQFDLTPWIAQEGPDWGDGLISAYTAELSRGASVVDFRVPNRTVEIPLIIRALGGTSFATARALVQAKASLFQREGGRLRRTTTAGSTVYADVVNATLKLGGGWLQSAKDADLDATLSLECLPDFYEAEVTLADHTETSLSELVFTETTVRGDYPARVRVVVDEDDGDAQLGLIWGFRNRHYSSASTARLQYEAEALGGTIVGGTIVALTGASGGTVVRSAALQTFWQPMLTTDMAGTTALTHTGSYRVWARVHTTAGTSATDAALPELRFVYGTGRAARPEENDRVVVPGGGAFYNVDLGSIRLDPAPTGTHRWKGVIQSQGGTAGQTVSVDKLWFQPLDEFAGILRAEQSSIVGQVSLSARDDFTSLGGGSNLSGRAAPLGGTWTTTAAGAGGSTTDFQGDGAGNIRRTTISDGLSGYLYGRRAMFSATYSEVEVGGDLWISAFPAADGMFYPACLCRYVDTSNFAAFSYVKLFGDHKVWLYAVIAGVFTVLGYTSVPAITSTWLTLRLQAKASGQVTGNVYLRGNSAPLYTLSGGHAALATGGALASGLSGIQDYNGSAEASTRLYDNVYAAGQVSGTPVPTDVVMEASQSLELRHDGVFREELTGNSYVPVTPLGDLPRLPPTVEGRTTEVFIKASRGDFNDLPDLGIDDISARITYRPTWLTVPGT